MCLERDLWESEDERECRAGRGHLGADSLEHDRSPGDERLEDGMVESLNSGVGGLGKYEG